MDIEPIILFYCTLYKLTKRRRFKVIIFCTLLPLCCILGNDSQVWTYYVAIPLQRSVNKLLVYLFKGTIISSRCIAIFMTRSVRLQYTQWNIHSCLFTTENENGMLVFNDILSSMMLLFSIKYRCLFLVLLLLTKHVTNLNDQYYRLCVTEARADLAAWWRYSLPL